MWSLVNPVTLRTSNPIEQFAILKEVKKKDVYTEIFVSWRVRNFDVLVPPPSKIYFFYNIFLCQFEFSLDMNIRDNIFEEEL